MIGWKFWNGKKKKKVYGLSTILAIDNVSFGINV